MDTIFYQTDDWIRSLVQDMMQDMADQMAKSNPANFQVRRFWESLANGQVRKFWEILKMEKNSNVALELARHQRNKAEKEIKDLKNRKNPDWQRIDQAEAKKLFWSQVQQIVDDAQFRKKLQEKGVSKPEDLLALQLLFAETLYCEFLYSK